MAGKVNEPLCRCFFTTPIYWKRGNVYSKAWRLIMFPFWPSYFTMSSCIGQVLIYFISEAFQYCEVKYFDNFSKHFLNSIIASIQPFQRQRTKAIHSIPPSL